MPLAAKGKPGGRVGRQSPHCPGLAKVIPLMGHELEYLSSHPISNWLRVAFWERRKGGRKRGKEGRKERRRKEGREGEGKEGEGPDGSSVMV